MLNSVDFSGRQFHFLGIGGIGMSAIAHILAHRNLPVSGSDLKLSHITERLEAMGVRVFIGQNAANLSHLSAASLSAIPSAIPSSSPSPEHLLPQIVCSTAISTTNPEYAAAVALGCPIFHRSDVLAGLIKDYKSISIGGTHGKTTTSSLIGCVLLEAGLDPTIIIGGEVAAWQGNARAGNGPYLVAEADESDGSLVKFKSYIGIVTNIEHDHPDHYSSLEQVIETFETFAENSEIVIGCIDCATVASRIRPAISYSLNRDSGATYAVDQIKYGPTGTRAQVWERDVLLGEVEVSLLGSHNLSNALAAIAVGRLLGADFKDINRALSTFGGTKRRFEVRGEANGILFIDDYAHHPSELKVTLAAARIQAGDRACPKHRIVALFQPHRYTRTLAFLPEFAQSFVEADVVAITDIYSAGEQNLGHITGQQLVDPILAYQSNVHYCPTMDDVKMFCKKTLEPGDLVLFLGAGNLNQIIPDAMTLVQQE